MLKLLRITSYQNEALHFAVVFEHGAAPLASGI